MTVRVHLMGYLARFSPSGGEKFELDLAPEATVGALLEKIGFPAGHEKMILVNGRQSDSTTSLGDKDEVFIFSPATGG